MQCPDNGFSESCVWRFLFTVADLLSIPQLPNVQTMAPQKHLLGDDFDRFIKLDQDEETRMNALLNELSIALDPLQVMAVVLPVVEVAMSKAIGFDITQAVPLANGDNAWSQAWEARAAAHATKHGEAHVCQSALSF